MKKRYNSFVTMEHNAPERFILAVDIVIFTVQNGELKVLLITRSNEPFEGTLALPGGFLHSGESSLQAAERILKDKAGVSGVYIEQLYTWDETDRDPRGSIPSISYFALVDEKKLSIKESNTTEHPVLEDVHNLPKLAFDHEKIINYAVQRLRSKLEYTNVSYSLLPRIFTMTELQNTYEAILGHSLDKRNFRKKFQSLGLIEPTGERVEGQPNRPAQLFRFISSKPQELQRWF